MTTDPIRVLSTAAIGAEPGHEGVEACSVDNPPSRAAVTRTSYPEIPPRVEYAATELGRSLSVPVIELARWAAAHHDDILDARETFDDEREASAARR